MAAEQLLEQAGAAGRIIPVPRIIRASCGLAWRADPRDRDAILACLSDQGIAWEDAVVIDL